MPLEQHGVSRVDWLERLIEAGFVRCGTWRLTNDVPTCTLLSHQENAGILYALVSDGAVLYVGKTTKTLKQRMYQYEHPGPSQLTNIANHQQLRQVLASGRSVDLYVLVDTAGIRHAGFRVSLAAGLEDDIIATVDPVWNKAGRRTR